MSQVGGTPGPTLLALPPFEQAVETLYALTTHDETREGDGEDEAEMPDAQQQKEDNAQQKEAEAEAMDALVEQLERTRTVAQLKALLDDAPLLMVREKEVQDDVTRFIEACLLAEDKIK